MIDQQQLPLERRPTPLRVSECNFSFDAWRGAAWALTKGIIASARAYTGE